MPAGSAKLRLLIVTDEMEVGGTQRQIVNLARGIDARRCDVTVAYFRHRSYLVDQLEAAGIRVLHLPKRGRIDAGFIVSLTRELRAGDFDVVHAFSFTAELWTAVARLALPRRARPALVTSIRGTYDWYGPVQWRLKRWVTRQSTRVVANSRAGAAFASERLALPLRAIDVVYNGVDPAPAQAGQRRALREQWGAPADALVVLFVGRLVEVKRVDTLVRAAALLKDAGRAPTVVICGDGPQRDALEALSRSLGLQDTVRFVGERADVEHLIEASDLVVLPSRQEGLSNVILEAMRGARPVVASRAGGNVELVEPGRNGLLFEVGDEPALAAAIRRLAEDPSLRQALGQQGAERIRSAFSLARMVQGLYAVYEDACRRPSALGALAR
jgi:glycosyltransferase involved in cell wall biosynthesis